MHDMDMIIRGCEYWIKNHKGEQLILEYTAVEDLLVLLKEQEAVEPKISTVEQRCGNCNKVIEMDGWKACPWCGKLIDWEGWWSKNGRNRQDFNGDQVDPGR